MAPTLAPPAGGFKWKDDEYWNKHEGLMTLTWPHHFEGRERVKNKPITINARSLSAANLPEMTLRPRCERPSTVPANMPSNMGRRFLDNIDSYMGKNDVGGQLESSPSTPGRRGGGPADRRAYSSEIGMPRNRVADSKSKFKDNMYVFGAGMGRAEPLIPRDEGARRLPGGAPPRYRKMEQMMKVTSKPMNMTGVAIGPYTNNQLYGARAGEADRPSSAADKGRKLRTVSSVVMGM